MAISAVIGGQWGDEGKGKIVDLLSQNAKAVARFQEGPMQATRCITVI